MIPYLLAVAGGYLLGNAFKDDMPSFAEGGRFADKDSYIVLENGNPIFYNLSIWGAKRIVSENPSERTMRKQEDNDLRYRIITYDSREDYEMGNFEFWQSEEYFEDAVERAKHYQEKYKPFRTEVYDAHKNEKIDINDYEYQILIYDLQPFPLSDNIIFNFYSKERPSDDDIFEKIESLEGAYSAKVFLVGKGVDVIQAMPNRDYVKRVSSYDLDD